MKDFELKDLYDGNFYHICTEGFEQDVIVKDEEDFYVARNYLALAAWRCGLFVVAFCIMSNHFHILVACRDRSQAVRYIKLFKQLYSTYLHNKYGEERSLKGCADSCVLITDIGYFRNCVAYILRNPLCAKICSKIEDYKWSSYYAYFNSEREVVRYDIHSLKGKRKRQILRTDMDLSGCQYKINEEGNIVLSSFVRSDMVEKAFKYSGRFFLFQLGSCKDTRMEYELVIRPFMTSDDQEILKIAQKCAKDYYKGRELSELSVGERCSMVKNLYFNYKSSIPQVSRVLGLARSLVRKMLSI